MEMLIQLTDRGCRKMNEEEWSTEEVLQQRIELDREQSQWQQDGLSSQPHEMRRMCEEARKYAMSSLDISKQFIEQTMQRQEVVDSQMFEVRRMCEQAQMSMMIVESELAELR